MPRDEVFVVERKQNRSYRGIVERFEAVARARLETTTSVADLCRAIEVTPRTLARALRAEHRTTPLQYVHALRFAAARQALLSQDATATSVTEVATQFGFRELGRFAV